MRKHLILTLGLALVLVMAVGVVGSGAWFTSGDTNVSTFTAGSLTVELSGPDGGGFLIEAPDNVGPINEIGGMAPGEEYGPFKFQVSNLQNPQSTLPAKYRFTESLTGGSAEFYGLLNVRIENGFCVGGTEYITFPFEVYNGPLAGMEMVSNDTSGAYQANTTLNGGVLNPQNSHCFLAFFELDETAGNSIQGETVNFEMSMDATQVSNPGWSQ